MCEQFTGSVKPKTPLNLPPCSFTTKLTRMPIKPQNSCIHFSHACAQVRLGTLPKASRDELGEPLTAHCFNAKFPL